MCDQGRGGEGGDEYSSGYQQNKAKTHKKKIISRLLHTRKKKDSRSHWRLFLKSLCVVLFLWVVDLPPSHHSTGKP